MNSLLLAAMLVCPQTLTNTKGEVKWTHKDTDFVAKLVDQQWCSQKTKGHSECVKMVTKLGFQNYYVMCSIKPKGEQHEDGQ